MAPASSTEAHRELSMSVLMPLRGLVRPVQGAKQHSTDMPAPVMIWAFRTPAHHVRVARYGRERSHHQHRQKMSRRLQGDRAAGALPHHELDRNALPVADLDSTVEQ